MKYFVDLWKSPTPRANHDLQNLKKHFETRCSFLWIDFNPFHSRMQGVQGVFESDPADMEKMSLTVYRFFLSKERKV